MSSGKVKLFFSNFNTDRRLLNRLQGSWKNLLPENRIIETIDIVVNLLKNDTVCSVFVITKDVTESIIKGVDEKCGSEFAYHVGTYNTNETSFRYLIFVPMTYEVISVKNIFFTNPDNAPFPDEKRPATDADKKSAKWYLDATCGELFEKSFMYFHIRHSDEEFHFIVTHLGLQVSSRIMQMNKLATWIDSNIQHHEKIIVGGDFNAFDPSTNKIQQEQMKILLSRGFVNAVDFDHSTFTPYPYDVLFLMTDDNDKKTFTEILKRTSGGANASDADIEEFRNLVENAALSKGGAALDNVFHKNVKDTEINFIKTLSDHLALLFEFS